MSVAARRPFSQDPLAAFASPAVPAAFPFTPDLPDSLAELPRWARFPRVVAWYKAGELSSDLLNRLLAETWTLGGYAEKYGLRRIAAMFRAAGYVTDVAGGLPPTTPLTIFRGAVLTNAAGLSWSTDRDLAAWFARRLLSWSPRAYLFQVTLPPEAMLGRFDAAFEAEVVVDPSYLAGTVCSAMDAASAEVAIAAKQHLRRQVDRQRRYQRNAEARAARLAELDAEIATFGSEAADVFEMTLFPNINGNR